MHKEQQRIKEIKKTGKLLFEHEVDNWKIQAYEIDDDNIIDNWYGMTTNYRENIVIAIWSGCNKKIFKETLIHEMVHASARARAMKHCFPKIGEYEEYLATNLGVDISSMLTKVRKKI